MSTRPKRRAPQTVALATAALLLAGCAASDPETAETISAAEAPAETFAAVSVDPYWGGDLTAPESVDAEDSWADVVGPYAGFGIIAGNDEFPRTIRHALGETELLEKPTRIVTLDSGETEAVLALGITPVGISEMANLPDTVADLPKVGAVGEPNLEAILALEPDLILSNASRDEATYEQLSAIAPTILGVKTGAPWQQNTELYAMALGLEATEAEVRSDYLARAEEIAVLLAEDAPTASFIRIRTDDVRLYQRSSFAGSVMDAAGLPRGEEGNKDTNNTDLSAEQIELVDADLVFVAIDEDASQEDAEALLASGLWQSLSGVSGGGVTFVDSSIWYASSGYQGALRILDDIEEALRTYQTQ